MKTLYQFIKSNFLSGFTVNGMSEFCETETENRIVCSYADGDGVSLTVTAEIGEDAIVFYLNAKNPAGFAAQHALSWKLGPTVPDAMLGSHHKSPWWMYPSFTTDYNALLPKTQSLLIKSGALHYHLLPLTGDNFRCEFEAGEMFISSDKSGLCELSGAFLAVSVSSEALTAVENNYKNARRTGAIRVPLKEERTLPAHFDGFGWCTWDAFYKEVSSENIYKKLDEFREKGIPLKWLIIDDGWMQTNDRLLCSFTENDHFPEGLRATIARIKGEYGVEKVGIWHAFNGYWDGIDPESELAKTYADCLFTAASGKLLPSLDPDAAFRFWDAWHSYLADCGIDFLKVDNQSHNSIHLLETCPTAEGCRLAHEGIERSINKHFGGAVINCMGMDMENVLARPFSAVNRNSDDFFPNRERGFISHIIQNVYSAIWHDQMYYCDFDMWWSMHESAVQSGVLRAISGSPVYISDKIGASDPEKILPLIEDDGRIMRCDNAAKPTTDCIYVDCAKENKLLKIWNRSGDCFALAAFNVGEEDVTDTVDFGTIPGLSKECEYIAYEYFTKTFTRIHYFEDTELTLPRNGVAVWSIYPIKSDDDGEYILLGSTDKYVPIASQHKVKTAVSALLG